MRALTFAFRRLLRQPARTTLGVLGVAVVGALLFDMLLLSRGLVVSLRDLLDRFGYEVRVTATDAPPLAGPPIRETRAAMTALEAQPELTEVVPMRVGRARTSGAVESDAADAIVLVGIEPGTRRPWRLVHGEDLPAGEGAGEPAPLLLNRYAAERLGAGPGDRVVLQGICTTEASAVPPVTFRMTGVAEFPFESGSEMTAAMRLEAYARTCGERGDPGEADMFLVGHADGVSPEMAVAAIRRTRPDLHAFTNEQLLARFQQTDFSYFRQISAVLATITIFFGFLLIAVLLTVSVNQRFGEIAALRAMGFSRRRVVADVLCESSLLVAAGGLLALPLGLLMARWLDALLRGMPGLPEGLHFFVFEPRALAVHAALMAATATLAALYPVWLVARLPIALTLRREVLS